MYYSQLIVPRLSENEGSVVGETNSQVAVLTRVLREKKNKMEGFQHKPLDQSISEVYTMTVICVCVISILLQLHTPIMRILGRQTVICSVLEQLNASI